MHVLLVASFLINATGFPASEEGRHVSSYLNTASTTLSDENNEARPTGIKMTPMTVNAAMTYENYYKDKNTN